MTSHSPFIPRPFPVDPEVLARIQPMTAADATPAARLHAAGMGDSLWARLGTDFLEYLYQQMTEAPGFIGFTYREDHWVRGIIAGTEDPSRLFRHLARQRGGRLAWKALAGLRRDPSLLRLLLTTGSYFSRSGDRIQGGGAESLFCAVEPNLRGTRVAGHLNKVLFDELLFRGHPRVKITTEASNEGARRQLTSWGFVSTSAFSFYGKEMIRYELDLKSSPRVEAISRHWGDPRRTTGLGGRPGG